MFKSIKFFISKFQSSKFIRKGKCLKCGKCCRNILLSIEDEPIRTEEQFERTKKWDKHFCNFYISGKSETGALLFTCRAIDENNRCKVYFLRGLGCRMYPHISSKFLINGGKPLEGCGYYYDIDKDFKSYLR